MRQEHNSIGHTERTPGMDLNRDIIAEMNKRYPGRGHSLPHPPQERYSKQEVRDMVEETLKRIDKGAEMQEEKAYQRQKDRSEGISY